MTAAAKEYRETVALKRTLQKDPKKGYELLQQQLNDIPFPSINSEEGEEEAGAPV